MTNSCPVQYELASEARNAAFGQDPGVVDQDVEPSEAFHGSTDGALPRGLIGHVEPLISATLPSSCPIASSS